MSRMRLLTVSGHFDVPDGKWQTVASSPVSSARAASPAFQARAPILVLGVHADHRLAGQLGGQDAGRLSRPPQRGHRVAPGRLV
jgi:hypothetical protein